MYDVIVVGGGPSGLMAAIAASQAKDINATSQAPGIKVLLIDKGDKLGRKLGISGGGRCNVTNIKETDELIRHIPGNGRFLYSAFSHFDNKDIVRFFEGLGIALKEEDNGRMFPVSDKAKTVVDALVGQVRRQGVHIRVNEPVERLLLSEACGSVLAAEQQELGDEVTGRHVKGIRLRSGEELKARAVIIATGGKSVPHTGSTGDAYPWAEAAGHTITELFPTEVPLTSREPWVLSKELQGLSLRGIVMRVWNAKGKAVVAHEGDMIFTHFGLSGPVALRCSQYVVKALKQAKPAKAEGAASVTGEAPWDATGGTTSDAAEKTTVLVTIDLLPDQSEEDIYAATLQLAQGEPRKAIKNVLKGYFPERLIPLLLRLAGLPETLTFDNLPKQGWQQLARLAKRFPVEVNGTLSLEEAFVTGGGVSLKGIDPRTLMSKHTHGLFFCGEVLDVHGYTGGYNITAAFATGYTAGKHAAALIHQGMASLPADKAPPNR